MNTRFLNSVGMSRLLAQLDRAQRQTGWQAGFLMQITSNQFSSKFGLVRFTHMVNLHQLATDLAQLRCLPSVQEA